MLIWIVVAPGTEHSLARRAVKHSFTSAFRPNPLALRQSPRHSQTRGIEATLRTALEPGAPQGTRLSMCDAGIAGRLRSLWRG